MEVDSEPGPEPGPKFQCRYTIRPPPTKLDQPKLENSATLQPSLRRVTFPLKTTPMTQHESARQSKLEEDRTIKSRDGSREAA